MFTPDNILGKIHIKEGLLYKTNLLNIKIFKRILKFLIFIKKSGNFCLKGVYTRYFFICINYNFLNSLLTKLASHYVYYQGTLTPGSIESPADFSRYFKLYIKKIDFLG